MSTLYITLIFIIFIELLSRVLEGKAIRETSISSISQSDYRPPTYLQWLRVTTVIIILTTMSIASALDGALILMIGLILIFLLVRSFFVKMVIAAAKKTKAYRISEVLNSNEFKNSGFLLYFSAPDLREPTHVTMWTESLSSLQIPWFVLLREREHLSYFVELKYPHVILIENAADLNAILPINANIIFYTNNGQKNRHMINAEPNATHIQLLHGDSDKPPSYSPLSKNYDYLFVAGQMAIDRYRNHGIEIPSEKFKIVGRPQVSGINTAIEPYRLRSIGYMPTWKGFYEDTQLSSLDKAVDITKLVIENFADASLLFKPHPMSFKDPSWKKIQRSVASQISKNGRLAKSSETPFDIYNESDILITDISSVMIDYLYSGKPIIVVLPEGFTNSDTWRYPSLAAAYLVDADLNNLVETINLATSEDPMRAKRLDVRKEAFGDFPKPAGTAFRETCLSLINKNYNRMPNDE